MPLTAVHFARLIRCELEFAPERGRYPDLCRESAISFPSLFGVDGFDDVRVESYLATL
jgi:hypothetical protein